MIQLPAQMQVIRIQDPGERNPLPVSNDVNRASSAPNQKYVALATNHGAEVCTPDHTVLKCTRPLALCFFLSNVFAKTSVFCCPPPALISCLIHNRGCRPAARRLARRQHLQSHAGSTQRQGQMSLSQVLITPHHTTQYFFSLLLALNLC